MINELKWQKEFDKNHGFDTVTFVAIREADSMEKSQT
jgi:hypothetical protein